MRVLPFLFLVGLSLRAGDSPFERYRPATLPEALKAMATLHSPGCRYTFGQGLQAFQVEVRWTGRSRPLTGTHKGFLEAWQKAGYASALPAPATQVFSEEIEVSGQGTTCWVLFQAVLMPALREEVPGGGPFVLYVAGIGGIEDELLLAGNEFRAP